MLLKKKKEIENWLNQYHIQNYELIKDKKYGYIVNCKTPVSLSYKNLKSIDIKFNEVNGFFDCSNNDLISLEGSPVKCHDFYCQNNQLTSLKYSPLFLNSLEASSNNLIKLDCETIQINAYLDVSFNKIKKIEKIPKVMTIYLSNNDLNIKNLSEFQFVNNCSLILYGNQLLGDLQTVITSNELKEKINEILNIKKEKENLLNIINKKDLDINNKNINKI